MNNSLYDQFAASFAAKSLSSLVDSFNCQVGCRGFNSARAAHDRALIAMNSSVVALTFQL